MKRTSPYKIDRDLDRYAKRVTFASPDWVPAITLKLSCDLRKAQDAAKEQGTNMHAVFIKALAIALAEHPALNFFCIRGKLLWAGDETRISTVIEEESMNECTNIVIYDAESKDLKRVSRDMREGIRDSRNRKKPCGSFFINSFPRLAQRIRIFTGSFAKELKNTQAPILLTELGNADIEELKPGGAAYSTIIAPCISSDGTCIINVSFNHQLANARPIAAFAARFKAILESPEALA